MTDEARLARLTELARRVWPELERPHVWAPTEVGTAIPGCALDDEGLEYIHVHPHPRALDALEAALLVLADEERVPLTERRVFEDRIEALERDRATLVRRYKDRELEQAAWVEALAQEWEVKAGTIARRVAQRLPSNEYAPLLTEMLTTVVDGLARELRERAKRGSE